MANVKRLEIEELSVQDLRDVIREELRNALKGLNPTEFQKDEYLTVEETKKMLKISAPTLDRWVEKRYLTKYAMGNRVYYKRSEIEKKVSALK